MTNSEPYVVGEIVTVIKRNGERIRGIVADVFGGMCNVRVEFGYLTVSVERLEHGFFE